MSTPFWPDAVLEGECRCGVELYEGDDFLVNADGSISCADCIDLDLRSPSSAASERPGGSERFAPAPRPALT